MPVVPLGLTLQMLEHPSVFLVHIRTVGVLAIRLLAFEDDAEPDLVGVLGAAKGRVVEPARGRISLERPHLLHQLLLVAGLDEISRDGAKHHLNPPPSAIVTSTAGSVQRAVRTLSNEVPGRPNKRALVPLEAECPDAGKPWSSPCPLRSRS